MDLCNEFISSNPILYCHPKGEVGERGKRRGKKQNNKRVIRWLE